MMEGAVRKRAMTLRKRKKGQQKSGGKSEKSMKTFPRMGKKIDKKMKKLFRKRAREYNSDDDEKSDPEVTEGEQVKSKTTKGEVHRKTYRRNVEEGPEMLEQYQDTEDDDKDEEEMQPGIMRFTDGCRAFRMAFVNIMKRHVDDDDLGPILSAHKKLVVAKLAEEEAERKVKKETKKEKHLAGEKGHVKPANYLDSHEKFLIGVATKGVVKLFNAVNKAQNAQRGLNPSRLKDAKGLRQRRKQAFFSELSKGSGQSVDAASKASNLTDQAHCDQPAWAPLRDSFMLTNPKLKDWDKMAEDPTATDDIGLMSDASSDEE